MAKKEDVLTEETRTDQDEQTETVEGTVNQDDNKTKPTPRKSNGKSDKTGVFSIAAPTAYTGMIGGVQFVGGAAKTDDEWKAQWFKNRGYTVS